MGQRGFRPARLAPRARLVKAPDDVTRVLARAAVSAPRFEPMVIVGAGFAGLAAAAAAREHDVDPLIVDEGEAVGGAWSRMPPSMPCISLRFRDRLPDGSYPDGLGDHATAAQVRDAIQSYAERSHFRVELGVRVMAAEQDASTVRVRTTAGEISTGHLVVATGEYGCPRIPRGLSIRFEGAIQHSSEFRASTVLPHERIVVIGAGNSGAEVALAASAAGARVTLCSAQPYARPRGEPRGAVWQELAWLGSGIPVAALPRRGGCRARVPVAGETLWNAVERGSIALVGRALAIESRVVRLESGEVRAADRVVLATGFRRDLEFLGDAIRLDADGLPLHRHGLSRDLAGVAFVGLPCQRTRRSGFLRGFAADARAVVGRILTG